MRKKLSTLLCTALVCAALPLALTACDIGGKGGDNGGGGNNTTNPPAMSNSELVGFSAATSANILASLNNANAASTAAKDDTPTDDEKALVERINAQIQLIENFVGDSPVTVTEAESDKAEYAKMINITTVGLDGESVVYVMYFNETLEVEDDDDDDAQNVPGFDDEQEFAITGIMISDGVEYALEGSKELEEDEYELSFKASVDDKNYVEFKQEIEDDEQEFCYKIYQNGVKVKSFSLEIENEDDEQKIEVKDSSATGSIKYSRKTEDGKTFIKVDVVENGVKNWVKVFSVTDSETGATGYRYLLNTGKEITIMNDAPQAPEII